MGIQPARLVAAVSLLLLGCSSSDEPARRPNILFLLTDDQRADTLGIAGHPVIETPNLDRLAADGVLFRQAHVTDPTCSPSRVTYFTGQYERVHGVGFSSSHRMTQSQWANTYPALLRQAGYFTGFVGKFGVEFYDFDAREKFDFWRAHDGWARFFPKPLEHCKIYRDSPEEIITPIMGESVERFLAAAPDERPFCLQVSFSAPHGSITTSMDVTDGGKIDNATESMTKPANRLPEIAGHPIYGSLYRDLT
ncbi:MAG: sulfatase-like hydrolase/transferase, partial [bacterium]|nr:sulfatase-like hydrolase/transferase [bacterium]